MTTINYKSAGVDITAGNEAVNRIKKGVQSTFSKAVLTDIGSFGAMYDLRKILEDYTHPVLVQSIDGVGTKIIVAKMMQKYDTIGIDLVSAVTNDIVVLGATPLTFLDYIANDSVDPKIIEEIVSGIVTACRENNISLVGGETAEMPGTYLSGEHDLVGVVTGVVDKEKAILGKTIQPDDAVLALTSSGLHTNGFSLARKCLFEVGKYSVNTYLDEYQKTLGEVLLAPHLNYNRPVHDLLEKHISIKGMAHITGGGLLENIPRILPTSCGVILHKSHWPIPPLFTLLQRLGNLPDPECYRTFNMGVGLVMILDSENAAAAQTILKSYEDFTVHEIGHVIESEKRVTLCE